MNLVVLRGSRIGKQLRITLSSTTVVDKKYTCFRVSEAKVQGKSCCCCLLLFQSTRRMGNTVTVVNKSNVVLNVALCIITRYYEANKILPNTTAEWNGVGYVWFSVVSVPWYGPDSEFGDCLATYYDFVDRIPFIAKNISQTGTAHMGYMRIVGRNVTRLQADERLRNLAFWGDGYKVAGYNLTFYGGPNATQVGDHVIDISEPFDNIRLSMNSESGIRDHDYNELRQMQDF